MHGPAIDVDLKFNSRVDGTRSSLSLVLPRWSGAASHAREAELRRMNWARMRNCTPGKYTLRWTALATDGHITRGEIPFTVE